MFSGSSSSHATAPFGLRRLLGSDRRFSNPTTLRRPASGRSLSREITFVIGGLVAVLAITVFYLHVPLGNVTTIGFTFLLAILIGAATGGFTTSLSMSFAAALVYDYYFIPPA